MNQAAEYKKVTFVDRFELGPRIAVGGMAEIYLATQKSLPGFEKQLVIKVLQRRYCDDKRVRRMFMDEARLGAYLNHPHIVHVYDVAEHDGVPFIAMEYIDGEDLSALCRRGIERDLFLPLEHAIELIAQAAHGMGYFHAASDSAAVPLHIVHRDISPPNLLVTQSGVLKVIDFGIARSSLTKEQDDKRTPGKYNYMAPEQVRGEAVDQRADIFSLGIVLYEITVGRRLFKGAPQKVMGEVTQGRIKPPTFVRRDFPPDLEAIIMRALETHPADRYSTAYELAFDLRKFLHAHSLESGSVRVAKYLDDLQAAGGGSRRPELSVVGESWQSDDAEDALDFNRDMALTPDGEAHEFGKPAVIRNGPFERTPVPEAPVSARVSFRPAATLNGLWILLASVAAIYLLTAFVANGWL